MSEIRDARTRVARHRRASPARRMARSEREQAITEEATRYFAEVGFEGTTQELARRLGVTQPLIYNYFPTKADLIEQVYQHVYLSRWQPSWGDTIRDRSRPLRERMKEFYHSYLNAIDEYEWIRISVYSGLRNVDLISRYLAKVEVALIRPIATEIRDASGGPDVETMPLTDEEIEVVWALHGSFVYLMIRKYVYGAKVPQNLDRLIEPMVDTYLDGVVAAARHRTAGQGS